MQRSRRTNPYPHTWEIPVVGVIAVLLLLLLGVQASRSVANLLAGNGWVFVPREGLFTSLGGIVGGDAASGLTGVRDPASTGLMWWCIAFLELVVLVGCLCVGKWSLDRWGPGRLQGMATDPRHVLGRGVSRRVRPPVELPAGRSSRTR